MKYETDIAARAAAESLDRISIRQRSGIWCVELNGKFYGDYTRRTWAIEAAFEKADAVSSNGGAAVITWTVDGQQDALLYDSRPVSPARLELEQHALKATSPRKRRAPRKRVPEWRPGLRGDNSAASGPRSGRSP